LGNDLSFKIREIIQDTPSKEIELFNNLRENMEFQNIIIDKIFSLSCPTLAQNISNKRTIFQQRFQANPKVFNSKSWRSERNPLRSLTIDHFNSQVFSFDWNTNSAYDDCPILAVVHATSFQKALKIAESGFAALSILDAGFYGKGIYFSSYAIYTVPYVFSESDPSMLICFILPGNPFPVIEHPRNFTGKPILQGYQCHYVVTMKSGLPFTEEDFRKNQRNFNEIVLGDESQVVPIFLIKLNKSNFGRLYYEYQRETPADFDKPQINISAHNEIEQEIGNMSCRLQNLTYEGSEEKIDPPEITY